MLEIKDKQDYESAINNNKCCLFYITADWCDPCQKIKPTIKELEEQYKDKITFFSVNIDMDDDDFPFCRDDVSSIPTFLVFVGLNCLEERLVGADKKGLIKLLEDVDKQYLTQSS